ncbi:DUF2306 domain-containing protein [Ruegeria sediminis]|nr:DUF2306 domain-containing protein [Ruegeria sediminis]
MPEAQSTRWRGKTWAAWGTLAITCVAYGVFALAAGFGLAESEKTRALPLPFQIHALAGGIALITGIAQFNPAIRNRFVRAHRWSGRTYVLAACLASIAAVLNAAFFDVSLAARMSFVLLGCCWLLSTLLAYWMIRKPNVSLHREWMLRSFSLALFFVTFSFWVPVLAGNGQGKDTAYFLAVTMSWGLNLLVAEVWIWQTRTGGSAPDT